jgi:predicted metal-dependent HD superfamily phosphohydrolase
MNLDPQLQERWIRLWERLGVDHGNIDWFRKLHSSYSESHRHYHNLEHVRECLAEFDASATEANDPTTLELAIWFHDVIYDPPAHDNEEKSTEFAANCLQNSGNPNYVPSVSTLIMATKDHACTAASDCVLMIDIDLSILGKPTAKFLQYEQAIRKEYEWVPWEIFAPKRAEILEKFLSRESIFRTKRLNDNYEKQARINLQESLASLKTQFSK